MTNFLATPAPTTEPPPTRSRLATATLFLGFLGIPLVLLGLGMYFFGLFGDALVAVAGGSVMAIGSMGLLVSGAAWHYQRQAQPRWLNPRPGWLLLAAVFIPAVICGGISMGLEMGIAFVMPFAHTIAVISPALMVLVLVGIGHPMMTRLRAWGYLLGGAWAAPLMSLTFEVAIVAGMLVVGFALALVVPAAFGGLDQLLLAMQADPYLDVQEAFTLAELVDIVRSPGVLFGIWLTVGVVAPLVEEALKPIGVYLAVLFKRPLTVRMAFLGGVLGGIGFNITESLFNAAPTDVGWPAVMVVRIGTLLMHVVASGLVGWGVGMAVVKAQYYMAALGYLLAVVVHGLWNSLVVVILIGGLSLIDIVGDEIVPTTNPALIGFGALMVLIGLGGLLTLVGINGALLAWLSHRYRQHPPVSAREPKADPTTETQFATEDDLAIPPALS